MKLRLRSLQSRETLKLEVPNSCTLQQLRESLYQSLLPPPPAASCIGFSLNRKDELIGSSPEDSLSFLGIASGDLVYFSLNPSADFPSPASSVHERAETQERPGNNHLKEPVMVEIDQELDVDFRKPESVIDSEHEVLGLNFSGKEIPERPMSELGTETIVGTSCLNQDMRDTDNALKLAGTDMDIDAEYLNMSGQRFSVPFFLRSVLRKELDDESSEHKRLVIAIHAVFVESGFVAFDSLSGMVVDKFSIPDERASLWYTLPELLNNENNVVESAALKFQSLGHLVNVYGSLTKGGGSRVYRVCLDKNKFAGTMNLVWENCDKNDMINENDGSSRLRAENEVFEFWKVVKDGLALPLLIDLCDKSGLALPACLMRLPAELKLKILESIPGADVARMGCVCSEMRYLSSNNDIWKQKFLDEFGNGVGNQDMMNWKHRFALCWESKKKRKREIRIRPGFPGVYRPSYPIRRDPFPLGVSPIIGGDYDRLPGLGLPSPFGQPAHRFSPFHLRRNFSPNCNLGSSNNY